MVYREEFNLLSTNEDKLKNTQLVKPRYLVIQPKSKNVFENEWNDCLLQIKKLINNNKKVFRINVFIEISDSDNFTEKSETIDCSLKKEFKSQAPPISLIMEEPCENYSIICEIGYVDSPDIEISYGIFGDISYSLIDTGFYKEYWIIGANAVNNKSNIAALSQKAFIKLKTTYEHLGISFNQIARQWNYVGNIVDKRILQGKERQHYQMFNEARSEFYKKFRNLDYFPAATGIGMSHNGVCIDTLALQCTEKNLKLIPISNPAQQESYKYDQNILIGDPGCNRNENQAPQFERAMMVVLNHSARVYISGTASIIGQETVGIDDVKKQTLVTIENIDRLVSAKNLKNHYPALQSIPNTYSYVRVYIKKRSYLAAVKEICSKKYGNVATTYVVADICRDNLLVEIEAELN